MALTDASRRIHSAPNIQDILEVTAHEARHLLGAHQCVVNVHRIEADLAGMAVSLSDKYAAWEGYAETLTRQGIYSLVEQENASFRLTQAELEEHPAWRGFGSAKDRHPPMRGWLAAPLVTHGGNNLGIVQLSDRFDGEFTASDEALLAQLAGIAALALENAQHLAAAQAAEERLRRFLDSSLDLICTVTSDGLFHDVSANAFEILGYTASELVGRPYREFVHPDDLHATTEEEASVAQGQATRSFTNRYIKADGGVAHLYWSSVWSSTDQLFYCVVRDISERVAMEARLGRAERLEAIGQLTGGIAHDFNNLLTVILGSGEALVEALKESPELLELAELARGAGERGAELTSRLLAFARRQPLQPRLVNVAELISSLEPLIRRSIGDHIDTRTICTAEGLLCLVDPAQLETAILNLCINARDAMPDGGHLAIDCKGLRLEGGFRSRSDDLPAGDFIVISVSDTGIGMSQQTAERAFEPFYTTKPVGEGTGLGLSMVYGFIKQSGGTARIYSEADQGTSVKLYLPRSHLKAEPSAIEEEHVPVGTARVLVVEDDPLLRAQVLRQLTNLGYKVEVAEHGRAALDLLATDTAFDLLFTDVVMPGGLSGRQLADHVRLLVPEMKVLLTSGYTDDAIALRGGDAGYPLLSKPYRKVDLARTVAEILASGAGRHPTLA